MSTAFFDTSSVYDTNSAASGGVFATALSSLYFKFTTFKNNLGN